MGCLSKCFGFKSSRRVDEYEDQFNHELEIAIAMSLSVQEQLARQTRGANEQRMSAVEESPILEESSHSQEEERQRPEVELEEKQQHGQTSQNSLDGEEKVARKLERDDDKRVDETTQESLKVGRSPRQWQEKGKGKHAEDQETSDTKSPPSSCAGCNSAIKHGRSVNVLDAVWHPECFCCRVCHTPIALQEFSNSRGQFHKSCYKGRNGRYCHICKNKIPSTAEGRVFKKHGFWQEKYCPSHEADGTPMCCSCERLEPWGTNYVILDDGRRLCLECLDSAVMDPCQCHTLHVEIRDFFEGLNLKVEKEFPVLLVESQALNSAKEKEHMDHHYAVVTRGVCLSEEHVIPSISVGPKKGPDSQLIGLTTKSQRLIRTCEVTAILIMYGLPRLLTGSILAHEMMHAWLRLKGYRNLKPELEEGICQVLADRWLETKTYSCVNAEAPSSSSSATTPKKGDQPEFERRLVDFFKWQIKENDSPVYGDGFRKVNAIAEGAALRETVEIIKRSSTVFIG